MVVHLQNTPVKEETAWFMTFKEGKNKPLQGLDCPAYLLQMLQ